MGLTEGEVESMGKAIVNVKENIAIKTTTTVTTMPTTNKARQIQKTNVVR